MPREIGATIRAAQHARDAAWRRSPRWTIIRRVKFATRVHDIVYGYKARPLTRAARNSWARLLAHYTRSRALTYAEALHVAYVLAMELRSEDRTLTTTPETDDLLRTRLAVRLAAAARHKADAQGPRHDAQYERELLRARVAAHARQALLDGYCYRCGDDLPCRSCDIGSVRIDGRGGLVEVSVPA